MTHDELVAQPRDAVSHMSRPRAGRFLATFGFVWLMVGLFTGTVVLVLLVRWLLNLLNHWGLSQTAENRTLMVVIVAFIIGSFLLTRAVVRRLFRMESPTWRRATLASLLVPGAFSMWAWSNPTRVLSGLAGSERSAFGVRGGPQFIFGAYPDADQLRELKREGVTTVVSLQHPAVLVELQGIRAERETAASLGLRFVQAPMLPWVSDNTAAIEVIRRIAASPTGKFYIHCGLGRDRVNIAKRIVESVADSDQARIVATSGLKSAVGFEERLNGPPFQRGRIFQPIANVWVVPFPNADEMHGYILQGRPGHIFIALDPSDTAQTSWLRSVEPQFREYVVPFSTTNISPRDTSALPGLIRTVRATQTPVTVIVPTTTFENPVDSASGIGAFILRDLGAIPPGAVRPVAPTTTSRARR